ncbi:hypothetical protein LA66_06935 [Aureimonas altamirensis]|uniref:Uncharacterized protein n=1 Tax=Aureimonas altamirensis TaxID=370622 RepID=A0A0B1QBH6_9HYPH|nr:hypothetical protein LA66_06935 [Aureimonas altamirensis]
MTGDRYTKRKEEDGTWSVVDIFAGIPAAINGVPLIRLHLEEVSDLVNLLNAMDRKRRSSTQ